MTVAALILAGVACLLAALSFLASLGAATVARESHDRTTDALDLIRDSANASTALARGFIAQGKIRDARLDRLESKTTTDGGNVRRIDFTTPWGDA